MALQAGEHWQSGFVLDAAGNYAITTSQAGAAMQSGWLRDPDGRLVVIFL